MNILTKQGHQGRSREGAWIEIAAAGQPTNRHDCRSREGAWIEI